MEQRRNLRVISVTWSSHWKQTLESTGESNIFIMETILFGQIMLYDNALCGSEAIFVSGDI